MNQNISTNYLKKNSENYQNNVDIITTYFNFFNEILMKPSQVLKVSNFYFNYLEQQQILIKNLFLNSEIKSLPVLESSKVDKRFSNAEWDKYPYFNFFKQNHLLLEKLSLQTINETGIDYKKRKKLNFYSEQYMSAFSPSNYLFTNPEVIKLAFETDGESLSNGFNNLINDVEKGKISQINESAFVVGENLAITKGSIIFENELMQLIQYTSVTRKVFDTPILIIPPWINKYYILDLQPKNSFVKYLVDNGITVFMISWRNPNSTTSDFTFDDYVSKGSLKAIEIVIAISGTKKINTLGYCLGGTLLSITAAIISLKQKENPIASTTFLASMIDFSDIGPMGNIIDEELVSKLECGEFMQNGILNGADMETAFNLIRPNNLIWNYVINNYLKGIKPTEFDVMYWTNDNTNLTEAMYIYYMRYMILENKLSSKNALTIYNTLIDINKIDIPVFVIGLKEDTISPAITVFKTTELVSGHVEFILGDSGHIIGALNHPLSNKYGYSLNGTLGKGFDEWKKTSQHFEGSWWTPWVDRLLKFSGTEINAPLNEGNEIHKVIESAPGRYVKDKC